MCRVIIMWHFVYKYLLQNRIDLIPDLMYGIIFTQLQKTTDSHWAEGSYLIQKLVHFSLCWSWIDENPKEFWPRKKKTIGVFTQRTATITCLVFNEPAHHFVRHHLARCLQHRFFTLQHVMYTHVYITKYLVYYSMKPWPTNNVYKVQDQLEKEASAVKRLDKVSLSHL